MRKSTYTFYTLLFLTLFTAPAAAQNCDATPLTATLEGNVTKSIYSTGGDIWFNGSDAGYTVTPPGTVNPYGVFLAGGLWLGAKDPGGNLKISAQTYGRIQDRYDYQPGPLNQDGTQFSEDCENWSRSFSITAAAVRNHQAIYQGTDLRPEDIDPDILGWPGSGNPYFRDVNGFEMPNTTQGLAPFWDNDWDGTYDPTKGDFPLFCGDRALWSVFNDLSENTQSGTPQSLSTEIRLLAYSFDAADPALNATTFHQYTFVNRGREDHIDFYAAQWMDFDLGCGTNDQFNTIPDSDLLYIFNETPVEDSLCSGGIASSGATSPVAIVQMMEGLKAVNADSTAEFELGMTSLVSYYNGSFNQLDQGTTEPQTAEEYYHYLSGRWRDGQPITRGGLGYETGGDETLFANDGGQLADGSPWFSCNQVEANPYRDTRLVMSSGPVTMQAGAVNTMTIAVTTIFNVDYDRECPDESAVLAAATSVKDVFNQSCSLGALNTSLKPQPASALGLNVYPNPTNGVVTFELPTGERISNVQLFTVTGQRVADVTGTTGWVQYNPVTENLAPGVYFYVVRTASGKLASGRISVIR